MRKTPILATVIALSTLTLSGCTFYFRVVHVHTYDSGDTVAYFEGDWYEYCTACGAIGDIVSNTEGRTFLIDGEDALEDAMNKSGTQMLQQNITLNSTVAVSRRASVTLDLNGYDLYVNDGLNVLGSLSIVSEGSQYEDYEDEDEEYESIPVGDGTVHFSGSGITVGNTGYLETSEWVSFVATSGVDELVSVEGGTLSVYGVIDNESEGGTAIAATREGSVSLQESAEISASDTAIKLNDTASCNVYGATILSDNNGVVIIGTEPINNEQIEPENLVQPLEACECGCDSCTCEECACEDCENGECGEECQCECCEQEEDEEEIVTQNDHIAFNFYSGEIETVDGPAIITNKIVNMSEDETDASVVNIRDGEIVSENSTAISLNAEHTTCNITGGYICGDTAIEIKGGTLNIEDVAEGKEHVYIEAEGTFNYDDTTNTTSGVGIAIIYTGEDRINVSISSGTIVGGFDNEEIHEGPYAIYQVSLVSPCECETCKCTCECDECGCVPDCECGCTCDEDCECECECEGNCECDTECEGECGDDCTCDNCGDECECDEGCTCEDCGDECECECEGEDCDCGCATECECGCTCNVIPNYVHVNIAGGTFTGMIYSENLSEFIYEGTFVNDYADYDLDKTGYISSDTTKQMSGRNLIVTYVPPELEVEEG
ncbi:MAG: hypothetical protein LUC31_03760 [Coprobacillus sp.]|nr:hypothetical protein [Coprobacillus sp.]